MKSRVISFRIPNPNPVVEAFVDQTYELATQFEADYLRCVGEPFTGRSAILIASDYLTARHGEEAAWERFDVADFEAFVREHMPPFAGHLPHLMAAMGAFTNYLARHGLLSVERAAAVQERMLQVVSPAVQRKAARMALTLVRKRVKKKRVKKRHTRRRAA
jgi:hypothetical protein